MKNPVTFRGWSCRVEKRQYHQGGVDRIGLLLKDIHDGEPVAVATVNIPEIPLVPNEVIIKDYSENEGMLDTLIAAGVISAPSRSVQLRYVTVYICTCLI